MKSREERNREFDEAMREIATGGLHDVMAALYSMIVENTERLSAVENRKHKEK